MRRSHHSIAPILAALTLLGTLAASFAVSPLQAHEEGVLTLPSARLTAGGALPVKGSDFSRSTTYVLVLKGALREFELGRVTSDTAGGFEIELSLPGEARPGAYRLVAVAPDGDEASGVELEIEAAPVKESPDREEGPAESASYVAPSAEPLDIQRDWSAAEWFVLGALFGGALAGGLALLRRPGSAA